MTDEEIAKEQRDDQDIQKVIYWLENGEPNEHELQLSSPATKYFWNCRPQLKLENGVLYYQWIDTLQPKLLLVVPKSIREVVLESCHDQKTAGHFGQNKTINRLRQRFVWHGMRKDSLNYVRSCSV